MIPLARIKTHLRVEHEDEDGYIERLLEAACACVSRDLARGLYAGPEDIPAGDPAGMALTPDLEAAVLLLIGHWYAHREAVSETAANEAPLAYWRLVQHYRLYGV